MEKAQLRLAHLLIGKTRTGKGRGAWQSVRLFRLLGRLTRNIEFFGIKEGSFVGGGGEYLFTVEPILLNTVR